MDELNLDLQPRKENIREKIQPKVINFSLSEIEEHFQENLIFIKNQFKIADDLSAHNKIEDARTIWSAQIVLLESAFDFYLHELTKYGLNQMFIGEWSKSQKYFNIDVKMKIVDIALNTKENSEWFLDFANELYEKDTFLSYYSIKSQIKLLDLDINLIADKVFFDRNSTIKTIDKMKQAIGEIYDIRNLISHQAGRRNADAEKKEIDEKLVNKYIMTIENIVQAIHEQAINKV